MATVAGWEFRELADEVRPVDDTGNVDPLATPAGNTTPAVVQDSFGRSREFGDLKSFEAADAITDATLVNRDATLRAILDFKIDNFVDTDVGVLLERHGAASAIAFAVELERVSAATLRLRAFWDGPGASATTGIIFVKPTGVFEIAVVRTWNSETDVDVDYYVNGDLIFTENVAEGAIAPTSGGLIVIGRNGVTTTDYLPDDTVIQFMQLEDDPLPPEEIRQLFRRIFIHQPSGYQILRAFLPPGKAWSRDLDSRVQKWIAAEGDALGIEIADIERFREDFLPDRAYGGALEDWERILRVVPKESDTITDRRLRVLGFLRVVLGFKPASIKTALEPIFGLDAVDIDIIEFTGLRTDDFSVEDIIAEPSRIWITRELEGTIVVDIATPECDVSFGAVNALWFQDSEDRGVPNEGGPVREASISPGLGKTPDGTIFVIEHATGITPSDVFAGMFTRTTPKDVLFWGSMNVGEDLVHFRYENAAMSAATIIVAGAGVPQTLAMHYNGAGKYDLGRIVAGIFTVEVSDVDGPLDPLWLGFGAITRIITASSFTGSFRDAQIFEPETPRGFTYFAIRDPGLPGSFDIAQGQAQLNRQSPAHTRPISAETDQGFTLGPTGPGQLGIHPLFPKVG